MNFQAECSQWVVDEREFADILVGRETKNLDCLSEICSVEIEVVAWVGERSGGEEEWREEGKGRIGERRRGKECEGRRGNIKSLLSVIAASQSKYTTVINLDRYLGVC